MTEPRDLIIDPTGNGDATSIDDLALEPGDTVRFVPGHHLVTRMLDLPGLTIVGTRDGAATPVLRAPSGQGALSIHSGGSDLSHDPGTVNSGGLVAMRSAGPVTFRDVTIDGTLVLRCDAVIEGVTAHGDVAVEAAGVRFERSLLRRLVIWPSGSASVTGSQIELVYASGDLVAVDSLLGLSNRVVGGSRDEPRPTLRLLRTSVSGRLDLEDADCWIDGGTLTELFARSAFVHVRSCDVPDRPFWARIVGESVVRMFDAGAVSGIRLADTRARAWIDGNPVSHS